MNSTRINNYIDQAYSRWLDYASYHAEQALLHDQGQDLLHTVLESLLKKDPGFLEDLLSRKKGEYTELDFFALRMIKLNATSKTSPYRHKNKGLPVDANKDPWKMDILDEDPEAESYPERMLRFMRQSRKILAGLDISPREKEIYRWKFYGGLPIKSWPGQESYQAACATFNRVNELMKENANTATQGTKPTVLSEDEKIRRFAIRAVKASINIKREEESKVSKLAVRLLHVRARLRRVA